MLSRPVAWEAALWLKHRARKPRELPGKCRRAPVGLHKGFVDRVWGCRFRVEGSTVFFSRVFGFMALGLRFGGSRSASNGSLM